MLNQLTPEQEALIPVVRDEWINRALGGDTSLDVNMCTIPLKTFYASANIDETPPVMVLGSPLACQYAANLIIKDPNAIKTQAGRNKLITKAETAAITEAGLGFALTYVDFLYWFTLAGDCWWLSWADYFTKIGIVDNKEFEELKQFALAGIWDAILLPNAALLCRRPLKVNRDEENRLHNMTGPAVDWQDGSTNWFLHGMAIDRAWVENPKSITVEQVLAQENVELRRAMITLMGMPRFVSESKAEVLHNDTDASNMPRRLLRIPSGPDDEPIMLVEVNCPSTGKVAHLRVPPTTTACSEAVAWTFGLKVDDYAPAMET